ncbi:MAG: Fur family transcriptional regulator [Armatimonadota bacterium]|nr:Fur family transcriptional regulator [Armatimonadota bacterium]MDR7403694.1 Fur family transcriptional regulator [Armatimonadota bacterium]MDR7613026.1 Fur family transcriptional regulator [Armatimonadota bacterium]
MITAAKLAQAFRARGRRVTPQRALLFRLIERLQEDHPTAEALYVRAAREMPTLSLRTVYSTLEELAAMRVIRALHVGTGGMRVCVDPRRHHHVVCVKCGKTRDVFVDPGPLDVPLDQRQGFVITDHEIVFRGICAECR